jgi:hypothetical protein
MTYHKPIVPYDVLYRANMQSILAEANVTQSDLDALRATVEGSQEADSLQQQFETIAEYWTDLAFENQHSF